MKAIWNRLGGLGKISITILLVFISFVFFSFFAILVALPFVDNFSLLKGGAIDELMSTGMLRYLQIVQSISLFIIPSLLAGYLFWGHLTRGLGFSKPQWNMIILGFLIIISSQPLVNFLGLWNSGLSLPDFLAGLEQWMHQSEDNAVDLIFRFLDTDQITLLLVNVFMIIILPALGEEMLFRGVLQPIFIQWFRNKHVAVFLTAFIFSAIHLQFFTFLPRFFLGVVLGYLMIWGNNLWYPIAGHFANNFLSLILFYYYRYTHPEINPLQPLPDQMNISWVIVLLVSVVMGIFIWQYYNLSKKQRGRL